MYQKLAVAVLVALPSFSFAAEPGTHGKPLPTRDCLAPSRTFDWDRIDDTHVVFAGLGKRRYLVETATLCTELSRASATIAIDAGPLNRLCGRFGEALLVEGMRCRVRSVTPITKREYEALRNGELELPRETNAAAK